MNANERELILKDEVYQIVGAAMEVSNELGCGFLEAVYQESLAMEFDVRQIPHVPQKRIAIFYKGRALYNEYIADFLCYDQIIVEIKTIKANLPLGVIVNFGAPQLEWRRYANTKRDRQ